MVNVIQCTLVLHCSVHVYFVLQLHTLYTRSPTRRMDGAGDFFFWTRFGNLAAAANALWCTRLPARQLILGSELTCYNRDFDINELLPFCASFEQ